MKCRGCGGKGTVVVYGGSSDCTVCAGTGHVTRQQHKTWRSDFAIIDHYCGREGETQWDRDNPGGNKLISDR